jgi:hypothetical protein
VSPEFFFVVVYQLPAMSETDDVSPQEFLKHVREMTESRDREDRKRAADLEKDIAQSREQRRQRRAGNDFPRQLGPLN